MSISNDEENLQQQSTTNAGDQSTISLKQETSDIDEAAESWHEHDTSTNNNTNTNVSTDDDFVSLTTFADCFEMPVRRAQSRLGMGEAVFTKACRRVGIVRWPFRRIQSLQQAIASLRLQREETNSLLILQSVSHKMVLLHREIAFIKRNPETISLAMLSKRANRRKKECYVPHGYADLKGPATNEQIRAISEANRIEARAIRAERKKGARLVSAGEKLPKRSATQKPTARKRSRTTIDRNLSSSSSSSSTFQNNNNNDPHNDTYSSNVKTFKTSQTTMQTSSTAMRESSPDGVTQASLEQLVGMRSGTPTPSSPNTSLGSRSAGARSTAGSSTLLSFASAPSQSGPSFSSLLSLAQASSTADERSLTNRDTDDDNTATRQAGARSRRTRRRSPHTDKMSLTSLVEGENHPTSTTTTTTTATTNIDVGTDEQS